MSTGNAIAVFAVLYGAVGVLWFACFTLNLAGMTTAYRTPQERERDRKEARLAFLAPLWPIGMLALLAYVIHWVWRMAEWGQR